MRGSPRRSIARAQTSSACVESSPPETPITTFLIPVNWSRLASPCTWMWNTSSQRSSRVRGSDGTYGKRWYSRRGQQPLVGGQIQREAHGAERVSASTRSTRMLSPKVVWRIRSWDSRSRSISRGDKLRLRC